jgi:ribosomal protein S18 acetylase RimI-like enzyme
VRIRPAALTDARDVGPLLLDPSPSLVVIFGSPAAALRVARSAFRSKHTLFSCRNATVAEDEDGVVGLLVAVPGSAWPRLRVTTGLVMLAAAPHRAPWLVRRGRVLDRLTSSVPADSLYVSSLAVAAPARRKRVATMLMQEAMERARRPGLRRLALDVGVDSEGARRFYERVGFVETDRRETTERDREIIDAPGLIRMERPVPTAG